MVKQLPQQKITLSTFKAKQTLKMDKKSLKKINA
jgi:hypothetical protein